MIKICVKASLARNKFQQETLSTRMKKKRNEISSIFREIKLEHVTGLDVS